mgnify:CR=1 FL=1
MTGDCTLECWLKIETLSSTLGVNQQFINKRSSTGAPNVYSYRTFTSTSDDRYYFAYSNNGTQVSTGSTNDLLTAGVWTHLAVAFYAAAGSALFYKNGTVNGTFTGGSTSIEDGTAPLQIGATAGTVSPVEFMDGLIDEVRIWNVTRTAAQIAANYNIEIGTQTGLIAYYKLNNDYVDTANANNMAAAGAPVFSNDIPFDRSSSGLQNKFW